MKANGAADPNGGYRAQCFGKYPDFIAQVPSDYGGPYFKLSQTFPTAAPAGTPPWASFDFKNPAQADSYANAVLESAYEGMIPAAWRAEANNKSRWFHVPWMSHGNRPREFVYGMTDERSVAGPELGVKQGRRINNYAVGYYNETAGVTLGGVWGGAAPDPTKGAFAEGSAVVKILFTDAKAEDFDGPDLLAGAPSLSIYAKKRPGTGRSVQPVRLLQIDFATRDQRAGVTKWVFGTFAYDVNAAGSDPWRKMKLVGLMWGDDPDVTPATYGTGLRPDEGLLGASIPAYAKAHLGWKDRVNGPVDNPISSCLSCHGTAQYPATAPLFPPANGCSDEEKMAWFRNISGTTAFGTIDSATCELKPPQASDVGMDFSLQNAIGLGLAKNASNVNPCQEAVPAPPSPPHPAAPHPGSPRKVYELER